MQFGNCSFLNNSADSSGGAVYSISSPVSLDSTIALGNYSSNGAVVYSISSATTISRSTFFGNSSPDSGGVITLVSGAIGNIESSLFAYNSVFQVVSCADTFSTATASCSDIFGNSGGNWIGCLDTLNGVSGNISADPRFCDTLSGNFGLHITSPCAPLNSACAVTIGAIGVECDYLCGDANNDGVITLEDVINLVQYYFHGGNRPSYFQASDVNCDQQIDLADIMNLAFFIGENNRDLCCFGSSAPQISVPISESLQKTKKPTGKSSGRKQ